MPESRQYYLRHHCVLGHFEQRSLQVLCDFLFRMESILLEWQGSDYHTTMPEKQGLFYRLEWILSIDWKHLSHTSLISWLLN
jgi:hypothetical protein